MHGEHADHRRDDGDRRPPSTGRRAPDCSRRTRARSPTQARPHHAQLEDERGAGREDLLVAAPGPGHHEDPAVHVQDVDVVAVELARGRRLGRPPRRCRWRPGRRRGRRSGPSPAAAGSSRGPRGSTATFCSLAIRWSSATISWPAADVEVGQRLVEQQQPGPADQGVGDQHPLLLAPGELPDPGVGEAARRRRRAASRRPRARRLLERSGIPKPVTVDPERHQVPGPQRHVGVEQRLLGHVADRRGSGRSRVPASMNTVPAFGRCRPRMTRKSVVLPAPFEPISPVNSPASQLEGDVVENLATADRDVDASTRGPRPPVEAAGSSQVLGRGLVATAF